MIKKIVGTVAVGSIIVLSGAFAVGSWGATHPHRSVETITVPKKVGCEAFYIAANDPYPGSPEDHDYWMIQGTKAGCFHTD